MSSGAHPFDPLTPAEIVKAADIARSAFQDQCLNFRFITLKEPPKVQMIAFLEAQKNAERVESVIVTRSARVQIVIGGGTKQSKLFELIIDLDEGVVVQQEHLEGKHPYIDADYMKEVEEACIGDARVQKELSQMSLPSGAAVCAEPWAYATDGMNDMSRRTTMCYFYMRLNDHPDGNHYAYPLDLCAEVSEEPKVVRVFRLPSSEHDRSHEKCATPFDNRNVQAASEIEYHPDLRPPPRTTTKPYRVSQPEGPSFKVDGNFITWEKWTLHVGFNYREGITLHNICYDGRSVFYRLSLSEMFVPYGDPRPPYTRKAAFDLGSDGAGINANNLQLGCDCLGSIKYFHGWHNTPNGKPIKMPNVICCHEQDDGILWKHTNFRTQNAVVTRSRILVLQTIITVNNYEYVFAFHFGQDASIHYEVRATGILSTCPINSGDQVPYGTIVAPGVMAPYHQHLFCLRIDPAIDCYSSNSLAVEESHPLPLGDSSVYNPHGTGYRTKSKIIEDELGLDLDVTKNRTFKIVNEESLNPVNGQPVGFKLIPQYSQMLLAHPQSFHAKRSEFGGHAVWVTRYDDEEFFPSGRHTMQSMGGDGIASAIAKRRSAGQSSVRNTDIVVWHTFGSTHNPRIEDWPVMPSEKMIVGLKPVNFFTGNPSMDVMVSNQAVNQSIEVGGTSQDKPCCAPKL